MTGLPSINSSIQSASTSALRNHVTKPLPGFAVTADCADGTYLPGNKPVDSKSAIKSDRAILAQILGTATAVTIESFLSLMLTNRRFHQQINTITGSTGGLSVANHFRCVQFFTPARLAQFSVLLGGKSTGSAAYDSVTGTSGTTASKIAGGLFSTVVGLPFAAPMENVLVQGITAGSKGVPFHLTSVMRDTFQSIRGGQFRALGATAYREMPYGFCLATLPGLYADGVKSLGVGSGAADTAGSLLASITYTTLSHPFDVIKTAIQNRPDLADNTFNVGRQIIAERGVKALSSGYLMRLSKVFGTFVIIGQGAKVIERAIAPKIA